MDEAPAIKRFAERQMASAPNLQLATCNLFWDGVTRTEVWVPLGWYKDFERKPPAHVKAPDPSPEMATEPKPL